MKRTFNILSLAMIFALLASAVGVPPTLARAAVDWETVGTAEFSDGNVTFTSLDVYNGTPYIAYRDASIGDKATVMKFNGSTWEYVGVPGFSSSTVYDLSLDLDSDGTPYVAFRDDSCNASATVMKFNGSTWEYVGSCGFSGERTGLISLAVNNGIAYVAFDTSGTMGTGPNNLRVMRYMGSSWGSVSGSSVSSSRTIALSLVLDNDIPYLLYADELSRSARLMQFNGMFWSPLGSSITSDPLYLDLAIENGVPYVAYVAYSNSRKATVVKLDLDTYDWGFVGAPGFTGANASDISLVLYGGTPYLAYKDPDHAGKATVMTFDGSAWVPVGTPGFSAKLSVGNSLVEQGGALYLGYMDGVFDPMRMGYSGKATVMTHDLIDLPAVSLDPSSVEFGEVEFGFDAALDFNVYNSGDGDLVIGSLEISGDDFSLLGNSCDYETITPGNHCTVSVLFTPSAVGDMTGSVSIPSNAFTSPDSVELFGSGVDNAPNAPEALGPRYTTDAAPTITGMGEANTHIWVTYWDEQADMPMPLCDVLLDVTGAWSCVSSVSFPEGSFSLYAYATRGEQRSSDIQTYMVVDLPGGLAPELSLSATSWDFGDVPLGYPGRHYFTITNSGDLPLLIGEIEAIGSGFTVTDDGCSLGILRPFSNCIFMAVFHAEGTGPASGSLSIPSYSASSPDVIALSGNGVPLPPPTVWTGSTITFTKNNNTDWTNPANQDRLTDNVILTRASSRGLFNIARETAADSTCGGFTPSDTEWASGTLAEYDTLTYRPWIDWNGCTPPDMVGQDAVLHLISENIYLSIKFTSWTEGNGSGASGGGGFSYQRSTLYSDTTAPEPPVVNVPTGFVNHQAHSTISGTAEADSLINIWYLDGQSARVEVCQDVQADGAGSWSCNMPSTMPEGQIQLHVTATDAAGNTSTETLHSITIDTIQPSNPIMTAPGAFTNDATPTVSGTSEANAYIEVWYMDEEYSPVSMCQNAQADDFGNWSCVSSVALPERLVEIDVHATDAAGNMSGDAGYNVTVDLTAPAVSSLTRKDADPTTAATVDFTVTFSETVANAGTSDFTLNATGSITGATVNQVECTDAVCTVTVGTGTGSGTLGLNVRANASITDQAGNFLTGLPFVTGEVYTFDRVPAAGIYDDGDPRWVYSGNWIHLTGVTGPYASTDHYAGTVGNYAEFQFSGAKFKFTYVKSNTRGLIDILVDGTKIGQVNAYSGSLAWQATWTSPALTPGVHTVRFVHAGGHPYIDVDALQVFDAPPIAGVGNYDDNDTAWTFSSGWTTYNGGGPANNTSHYTSTVGSDAQLTFNGNRFILTYVKGSNRGLIDVYVDGSKIAQINARSSTTAWQQAWPSPTLTSGVHTVRFVHAGSSGTYIDIDKIQILAPSDLTAPAAIGNLTGIAGTTTGSVDLTWTAPGDDDITGTATSYLVRYSTSAISVGNWNTATPVAAGIPTPVAAGDPQTMTVSGLTPGASYFFAVRAQDEEGNLGGISNSPEIAAQGITAVGAGTYDDTDVNWLYTGAWTAYTGTGPANNTSRYTSTSGSEAQITINGVKFAFTYVKGANRGLIDVYVDGSKVTTINAYSATTRWQQTWTSSTLTPGEHIVRFVHAGTAGSYVDVDKIQVFRAVGMGTYDDMNANWVYSGTWTINNGVGPLNDTSHYTSTVGGEAQLLFTGTGFTLTYVKASNRGLIDVYVDGTKVTTINARSTTLTWQATWTSQPLTAGTHMVRFVHAGGGTYIDVDAITITP